jgi:hypothetical protein
MDIDNRLSGIYGRLRRSRSQVIPAEAILLLRDFDRRLQELEGTNERLEESSDSGRGDTEVSRQPVSSD